jgi:gas vesicle protein
MSKDPQEIREEIERTRGNLSEDVDAIADRVNPSNIAHRQGEKLKGSVRRAKDAVMGSAESVGGDASQLTHDAPGAVAEKTRGNPLAAGLIAFGAGLLVSSLVPGSDKEREMVGTLKEKAEPLTSELSEAGKSIAQDMKDPATEAVEEIRDSAKESAEALKAEATDEASHLQSQASDAAANLNDSEVSGDSGSRPNDSSGNDPLHRADGI